MEPLSADAILLYYFLVTVSDREGLSFYGDKRISCLLKTSPDRIIRSRNQLIANGLIAYQSPLYQVLDLKPPGDVTPGDYPVRIGDILKINLGGAT